MCDKDDPTHQIRLPSSFDNLLEDDSQRVGLSVRRDQMASNILRLPEKKKQQAIVLSPNEFKEQINLMALIKNKELM